MPAPRSITIERTALGDLTGREVEVERVDPVGHRVDVVHRPAVGRPADPVRERHVLEHALEALLARVAVERAAAGGVVERHAPDPEPTGRDRRRRRSGAARRRAGSRPACERIRRRGRPWPGGRRARPGRRRRSSARRRRPGRRAGSSGRRRSPDRRRAARAASMSTQSSRPVAASQRGHSPSSAPARIATSIGRGSHECGRADARARSGRRRTGARRRCGRALPARRDRGARPPRPRGRCRAGADGGRRRRRARLVLRARRSARRRAAAAAATPGGAVPDGGVVVALAGLRSVRSIEPLQWRAEIESGVTTREVQRLALENGLYYPPDPGAAEQSQLGGNVATNAGGPHAFKYGVTGAWVTGLEVAIAPGELVTFGSGAAQGRRRLRHPLAADRLGGHARDRDRRPAEADPAAGGPPPGRRLLRRRRRGSGRRPARDGERDAAGRDRVPRRRRLRHLRTRLSARARARRRGRRSS